jgi:hypothetical protein
MHSDSFNCEFSITKTKLIFLFNSIFFCDRTYTVFLITQFFLFIKDLAELYDPLPRNETIKNKVLITKSFSMKVINGADVFILIKSCCKSFYLQIKLILTIG